MTVAVYRGAAEEKVPCAHLLHFSVNALNGKLARSDKTTFPGETPDYEKTMILGAIITIGGEKLMREESLSLLSRTCRTHFRLVA